MAIAPLLELIAELAITVTGIRLDIYIIIKQSTFIVNI